MTQYPSLLPPVPYFTAVCPVGQLMAYLTCSQTTDVCNWSADVTHKGRVKLAGNIPFSPEPSLTPINQPSSCSEVNKINLKKDYNREIKTNSIQKNFFHLSP